MLHVSILVHISQVSGVFLKGKCQCSCTDTLTKLLTPCQYAKCFRRCWCEESSIVGWAKLSNRSSPLARGVRMWCGARDSVVFEGWCQCCCTDKVTKILTPCRCGKCFRQCLAIYFTWPVAVGCRFFVLCAAFATVRAVITTVRAKKLKSQSKWVMI